MPFTSWLVLHLEMIDLVAFNELSAWQLWLVAAFTCTLVVQLFYYFFFFIRFVFYKPSELTQSLPPISVIICAWNEEDNLKKNLQRVLEQDYPEYEVIVVNDHSRDDTELLIQEWQKKYAHLRLIELNQENAKSRGKKFAVSLGIKGAKHDRLIFTDADCFPKSDLWLKLMSNGFENDKEVVLGYGAYEKYPGFLNKFYRYESLQIAMQYFSYAMAKMPYMGVGRNLAYKKDLFFATKGFIKHRHISSGDDDLMVNEVATGSNTSIEIRKEAHTVSEPRKTMAEWWLQKRRHLTTGGHYRLGSKLFLGIYLASQVFFYLLLIGVLSATTLYWYALCAILIKWVVHLSIISVVARLLDEHDLLLFSLIGDLFSPFFNIVVAISNRVNPPIRWR